MTYHSFQTMSAASLAVIAMAVAVHAGDKDSVVDYFKSTGRDASYAGREQQFQKLHPGSKYTGSVEQSRELLGVFRVADMTGSQVDGLALPSNASTALSTQRDWADEFGGWKPKDCQPISRPSSNPLMRKIDSIAGSRGACCGPGNDCSHFSPHCDSFLRSQDRACAVHDRALKNCNSSWDDWDNQCVMDAHRELASTSIDPLIANTFDAMSNRRESQTFAPPGNKLDDGRLVPNGFDFSKPSRPKGFSTPVFPTGFEW